MISAIISLAFVLRLSCIVLLGRHIRPEVWEYNDIALNILSGKGYLYRLFNTDYYSFGYPAYSYISAAFHFLTKENYFALEIFQAALSAWTCYFVFLIAKKLFNSKTGLLAAFLAAVHPGSIIYSSKIHELTLVAFLITAVFWMIISMDIRKASDNMLIGLVIGLGILTRPTFIFILPVYLLYAAGKTRPFKDCLKYFAVVLFCAVIVITPWTIRNYNIHKRLIFITTTSAEHFWRGNNPLATGSALTKDRKTIIDIAPKEFLDRLYSSNEIGQYDLFMKETISFIKKNPAFFANMLMRKFYYFWWFSPQAGLTYPALWGSIYKIFYIILAVFFIPGVWFGVRRGSDRFAVLSLLLLFLLISAANSIYYVEMRHRWAIEPLILIFSSFGFFQVTDFLKRNKT